MSATIYKGRPFATIFELRRELQKSRKVVLESTEIKGGRPVSKSIFYNHKANLFVNVDGEVMPFGLDDFAALEFYNKS